MLERALAIAGLVIGLPGFVLLFVSVNVAIPIIMLVLAALACGGWYYAHFMSNQSPFTVMHNEITLSFEDGVRLAILEKRYTIRANVRDQRQIYFRNNSADGVFEGAFVDNLPLPDHSITAEGGDLRISVKLDPPPIKGESFVVLLKLHWRDAFNLNRETLIYQPDLPTKRATLKVVFPPDIPCREPYSRLIQGSGENGYVPPTVTSGGTSICLEIKNPKFGIEYKLGWSWDLPATSEADP